MRRLYHAKEGITFADFWYEVDKRGNRTQALEMLAHPATTNDTTIAYDDASIVWKGTWSDDSPYKKTESFSASMQVLFYGTELTLTVGTGPNLGMFDVYIGRSLWQTFDGLNNRISQTVNSVVTEYLLDVQPGLTKVIGATTSGNTERYVHAQRGIHAMEDSSGNWLHTAPDALGSVRMQLDDTLAVDAMRNFAPYGDTFGMQGTFDMPFGFTGEQWDGNELLYLRNRYLNPTLGVFPSLDLWEGTHDRVMSLNGYSWVEGNPVMNVDPSGKQPLEDACQQMQDMIDNYSLYGVGSLPPYRALC